MNVAFTCLVKEGNKYKEKNMERKECECCHERPGETNSEFLFDNPLSTPDCGDWVCGECEEMLKIERECETSCPCGCDGDPDKCVYQALK